MRKAITMTVIGMLLAGSGLSAPSAEKTYRGSCRLAAHKRNQHPKEEKTESKPLPAEEANLMSKRAEIDKLRREMLEQQLAGAATEAEEKAIRQKYDEATARLEEQRRAEDAARKADQKATEKSSGGKHKQMIWRGHSGSGHWKRKK